MTLSVRFFKHLFLTVLALMIIVPTTLAIVFGLSRAQLRAQVDAAAQRAQTAEEALQAAQQELAESAAADAASSSAVMDGTDLAYQTMYPDMYVEPPKEFSHSDNTVYLTFDDGPSYVTSTVLDTLDWQNVKATFFVIHRDGEDAEAYLKRIANDGHAIGIHSYSHQYTSIYASVEAFLDDFYRVWSWVYDVTGVKSTVFRFPGGSVNGYNRSVYMEIIAEMTRRGFTYYDWNVSSGDASASSVTSASIYESVVNGVRSTNRAIVLMHDGSGHSSTANALSDMIRTLKDDGRSFAPLSNDVYPIIFGYGS